MVILRAERRAGELLAGMELHGGRPPVARCNQAQRPRHRADAIPPLADCGVITREAIRRTLIGARLEDIYAEEAKERQGKRTDLETNIPANWPEGDARDQAGAAKGGRLNRPPYQPIQPSLRDSEHFLGSTRGIDTSYTPVP